jgi:hypothetical protein
MANLATSRVIGRVTAGTGDPEALTGTQVGGLIAIDNLSDVTVLGLYLVILFSMMALVGLILLWALSVLLALPITLLRRVMRGSRQKEY